MLSLTWTRANIVQCYKYKVKNSKLQKLKLKRKLSGNKIWRKLEYMCMFYLNFVCQNIRIQLHLYFTHDILRSTSFSMHSFVIFKIKSIITFSFSPFTSEIEACDLSSFCPLRSIQHLCDRYSFLLQYLKFAFSNIQVSNQKSSKRRKRV